MKLKNIITLILFLASAAILAVAVIVIPRSQYPVLTFIDTHTEKKVDYYLDAQKVTVAIVKQDQSIEFIAGDDKFTLVGEQNYKLVSGLTSSWNKTFEDVDVLNLVPPATCPSLLLRFKYLDYTELDAIDCISTPVQYSELI